MKNWKAVDAQELGELSGQHVIVLCHGLHVTGSLRSYAKVGDYEAHVRGDTGFARVTFRVADVAAINGHEILLR